MDIVKSLLKACLQCEFGELLTVSQSNKIASHADVLRGSSRVPAPRTSAEPQDKFVSHCSQISAGNHMQIIGDPIGAVEVKSVDKPNTYVQAL